MPTNSSRVPGPTRSGTSAPRNDSSSARENLTTDRHPVIRIPVVGVGGRAYRHQMDGGIVLGILAVLALSLSSALMLRLLLQLADAASTGSSTRPCPGSAVACTARVEQPTGRPIEEIASSIRRLGAAFYGGPRGRSWVKSEAFRRAYDEALAEGCRALEIYTDLLDLDPGTERDAERLRVEHLLAAAGLVLRRAA